jgi:hypothetical protein
MPLIDFAGVCLPQAHQKPDLAKTLALSRQPLGREIGVDRMSQKHTSTKRPRDRLGQLVRLNEVRAGGNGRIVGVLRLARLPVLIDLSQRCTGRRYNDRGARRN